MIVSPHKLVEYNEMSTSTAHCSLFDIMSTYLLVIIPYCLHNLSGVSVDGN
jgi:hypothetical protein